MTLRISPLGANAQARGLTGLLNNGLLRLYTEGRPPGIDGEPGGDLLVELRFDNPAFDTPENGIALANALTPAEAQVSGIATWFQCVTSDGEVVFDGTVGRADSGADLKLGTAAIQRGVEVVVDSITWRQRQEE